MAMNYSDDVDLGTPVLRTAFRDANGGRHFSLALILVLYGILLVAGLVTNVTVVVAIARKYRRKRRSELGRLG